MKAQYQRISIERRGIKTRKHHRKAARANVSIDAGGLLINLIENARGRVSVILNARRRVTAIAVTQASIAAAHQRRGTS